MAINFNFSYDSTTLSTAPADFFTAISYVANYLNGICNPSITTEISIQVGWGSLAGSAYSGVMSSESTSNVAPTYSATVSALKALNCAGSSILPGTSRQAGSIYLTAAQGKLIGITSSNTSLDGYIGVDTTKNWNYAGTAASGQYDFHGAFIHEVTEVCGRISYMQFSPSLYSIMDMYRYNSDGTICTAGTTTASYAYFSIDGGTTLLRSWNNNISSGQSDAGDWLGGLGTDGSGTSAFDGFITGGATTVPLLPVDLTLLSAVGFGTAAAQVTAGGRCPGVW